MKNILIRILLALIALPILFIIIYIYNFQNFLIFSFVLLLASIGGSKEIEDIFKKIDAKPYFNFILPSLIPISEYISLTYNDTSNTYSFIVLFLILLISAINAIRDDFDKILKRASASIFALIYPTLLAIIFVKIFFIQDAASWIVLLLTIVFANDSFAYIFGLLFGKNNKGIFKVSPNKSIAGFIGGTLASIFFAIIFAKYVLYLDVNNYLLALLGFILSIISNIGDLFESSIKRSINIKDSGFLILGRGGILDSIDSLYFATIALYLFIKFFGFM